MGKMNLKPSSISSKIVLALAGLFLMSFLLVHMSINLLMLCGDGGAMFNKAVGFMTHNFFIKIFEYVLFAGFIVHIIIALFLELRNLYVRPVNYAVSPKSKTSFFSKYMIHTGIIIFVFLILHFTHFFFVKIGWVDRPQNVHDNHDFLSMSQILFGNIGYTIFYIICFIFLSFHLSHAFQGAFQTLGFNHPRYTPTIKVLSVIYAMIIFIGFTIIPVYFLFSNILK